MPPIVLGLGDNAEWNDPLNLYSGKTPTFGLGDQPSASANAPKVAQDTPARPQGMSDRDWNDTVDTIIAEAVGEGEAGMSAVANVIRNRSNVRGKGIGDIVREPHQFTGYEKPGAETIKAMQDPATRRQAENILASVLSGQGQDPTGGADHYHADSVSPDWAPSMPQTATIGRHKFYNSKGERSTPTATTAFVPEHDPVGLYGPNDQFKDLLQGDKPTAAPNPEGKGLARLVREPEDAPAGSGGKLHFAHAGQEKIAPQFASILSDTSQALGRDFTITSGYRSPNHPVEAGKRTGPGQHATGTASDISMKGMSTGERQELVRELRARGVNRFGVYKNTPDMLHVDMKDQTGKGQPWFMYDRSNANMKHAPAWFQEVAANPGKAQPKNSIVVDSNFKANDGLGLYSGATNPLDAEAAARSEAVAAEKRKQEEAERQAAIEAGNVATDKQQADSNGRYVAVPESEADQWSQKWTEENQSTGIVGDVGRMMGAGNAGVALAAREAVGMIPVVGSTIVSGVDAIDEWITGQPVDERLDQYIDRANASVTPRQQEADAKNWWDDEKGTFGPAWSDPRSYLRGAAESAPGTIYTMAPGMILARGSFLAAIAAGATTPMAAGAAAKTAMIAGGISEGILGGGDSARNIKERIAQIPKEQLAESDAVKAMVAGGMSVDDAIAALTDDAATQAFVISGVTTGLFGGMGDRALAKIIAEGVEGTIGRRVVSGMLRGVVGEGIFEEMPQGVTQAVSENAAMRTVNPDQDLTEGVAEAAASGVAIGGAMGGGLGAAGGASRRAGTAPTQAPPAPEPDNRGPLRRSVDHGMERDAARTAEAAPAPIAAPVDGAPVLGATVRIDAEGLDPFMGTIDGFDGDDVIVVDNGSGEVYQVPLSNVTQIAPPIGDYTPPNQQQQQTTLPETSSDPALEPLPPVAGQRVTEIPPRSEDIPATEKRPTRPQPGQRVMVDDVNVGRFPARIESYQKEGTEAVVINDAGQALQVPITAMKVSGLTPAQIEQQELERNPPIEREIGDAGPNSRKITGKTVVLPDDNHAALYDIGREQVLAKRLGGATRVDIDAVLPAERKRLADAFGVKVEEIASMADDYRYRAERAAKEARSTLPVQMHQLNERLLKQRQAARSKEELENPVVSDADAQWWDVDLKANERKSILEQAGVKRPEKVMWQNLTPAIKKKLTDVRDAQNAAAEDVRTLAGEIAPPRSTPEDEFDVALRDSTKQSFAKFLDAEAELNRYENSLDAPQDVFDAYRDAADEMVANFQVTGLPGDSVGRVTAINSVDDIKAAFNRATAEERAKYWLNEPQTVSMDDAAHEAATSPTNNLPEPTQAQKEAGNYKVGRLKLGGLDISVENPAGSERKGVSSSGKAWSVEMKSHYGYIRGTVGRDKDHIDIFVRPGTETLDDASPVFVVDQRDPARGRFDEHKIMAGFDNEAQARAAYLENYTAGWKGLGDITQTTLGDFKTWLKSGATSEPFAPKSFASKDKADEYISKNNMGSTHEAVQRGKRFEVLEKERTKPAVESQKPEAFNPSEYPWSDVWGSDEDVISDALSRIASVNGGDQPITDAINADVSNKELLALIDTRWGEGGAGGNRYMIETRKGPVVTITMEKDTGNQRVVLRGKELADAVRKEFAESLDDMKRAQEAREKAEIVDKNQPKADIKPAKPDSTTPAADKKPISGIGSKKQADAIAALGANVTDLVETFGQGREMQGGQVFTIAEVTDDGAVTLTTPRSRMPLKLSLKELRAEIKAGLSFRKVAAQKPAVKSPAPSGAKPKKTKGPDAIDRYENYFRPGRDVEGYGGKDRVISFNRTGQRDWTVTVAEIKADGTLDRQRTHSTIPSDLELSRWERDNPVPVPTPRSKSNSKPAVPENTIFTDDAADKAREVLRKKLSGNTLNSGVDPELLQAGITLAGYHIEKGARTFAAYASAMLADLGEGARPYLKSWYAATILDPRFSQFDGMTPLAELAETNVNDIVAAEQSTAETAQQTSSVSERDQSGVTTEATGQDVQSDENSQSADEVVQAPAIDNEPDAPIPNKRKDPRTTGTRNDLQHVGLPSAPDDRPIIDWARDTIKRFSKSGHEYLLAVDDDGSVVEFGTAKKKTSTGINNKLLSAMMNPDRRIVVFHNHPNSGPLSAEDMAMLTLPGMHSVWAFGANGNEVRAVLTPEGEQLSGSLDAMDRWREAFEAARQSIDGFLRPMVESGTLDADKANAAYAIAPSIIAGKAGVIDISSNSNYDVTAIEGLEARLDKLAVAMKGQLTDGNSDLQHTRVSRRPARDVRHVAEVEGLARGSQRLAQRGSKPEGLSETRTADYSREDGGWGEIVRDFTDVKATRDNIVSRLRGVISDNKSSILATVPLNYFPELAGDKLPAINDYLIIKRKMDAYRSNRHDAAAEVMDRWRKYISTGMLRVNKSKAQELADLMHESTLSGIDPSLTTTEEQGKPGYEELRRRFTAIAPIGRRLFTEVRDAYREQADELDRLLLDNVRKTQEMAKQQAEREFRARIADIEASDMDPIERRKRVEDAQSKHEAAKTKNTWASKARMTQLRSMFESNRVPDPYFPLARFGDYFVAVKTPKRDEAGEIVGYDVLHFSRHEKARQMEQALAELKNEFPDAIVTSGVLSKGGELKSAMDPRVVGELDRLLADANVGDDIRDALYQRWLQTMPDLSMRKRAIHRKGIAGYNTDAFRVFASTTFHAAHQMARLKFGLELQENVNLAEEQAKAIDHNQNEMALVNEFFKRHQWTLNPTTKPLTNWITSAAFVYFLGATPAAALVNASQTVMVGIPVLSAKFGFAKSTSELVKATKEFTNAVVTETKTSSGIGDFFKNAGDLRNAKSLTPQERAAMDAFYESGLIDRTQSHDLAAVGETGTTYNPVREKVMNVVSYGFHKVEVFNRTVTAIAAYRLAREAGQSHLDAINSAHDLTYKTHFDMSNSSRPRVTQGDIPRLATMFRSFQINMLYRLFRDIHQAVKGESAQVRREARLQLTGVTGMMALNAGLTGTVGYGLAMAAGSVLKSMFGDDDDPLEFEERFRSDILQLLGPELGGIVLKGVPGHYLGIDLTSRIGMPDLWWRGEARELNSDDALKEFVYQNLGAGFGIVRNTYNGIDLALGGNMERGVETAAPKFIRDLLRFRRYASDGVETLRGDQVIPAEELSAWNLASQAMGFTPAKIADAYEVNTILRNAEQRIQERKREIVNRFAKAIEDGDEDAKQKALQEIRKYNSGTATKLNPITAKGLRQSLRVRVRNRQRSVGGVLIRNEALNQFLRNEVVGANTNSE